MASDYEGGIYSKGMADVCCEFAPCPAASSFGNGSAMRVSPVAWLFDDLEKVIEEAAATAAPTHNHPEGIKGAMAVAHAILLYVYGE